MKLPAVGIASFPSTESLESTTSTDQPSVDVPPSPAQEERGTKRRRITSRTTDHHKTSSGSSCLPHAALLKQLVLSRVPLTTDSILFTTAIQPAESDVSSFHLERYTSKVVNAIRANDVHTLQELLATNGPECFQACNRNGETLLHLACRRSQWPVIDFLVHQAHVPLTVRDLAGRNILHDVMWRPRPAPEIVEQLVAAATAAADDAAATSGPHHHHHQKQQQQLLHPHFLLLPDVRGHTPLDYCRGNDVASWYTALDKLLDKQ